MKINDPLRSKNYFGKNQMKKLKNYVGNITTTLPKNVSKDMKELLN